MTRPSRGDQKPCTEASCGGTMQFGRRSGDQAVAAPSEQTWTCDSIAHQDPFSRAPGFVAMPAAVRATAPRT